MAFSIYIAQYLLKIHCKFSINIICASFASVNQWFGHKMMKTDRMMHQFVYLYTGNKEGKQWFKLEVIVAI